MLHCLCWIPLLLLLHRQGANTGQYNSLLRLHNRQSMSDRVMQTASREVSQVCDRLRVTDAVRNSALEIYKDVSHCCGYMFLGCPSCSL
jgi:hypothetical protein